MTLAGDFFKEREITIHARSPKDLVDWAADQRKPGGLSGVSDSDEFEFLYRGQVNAAWGISSSLSRLCTKPLTEKALAEAERRVIEAVRAEGVGRGVNDGELLMVLQHHSIPTWLIDVSTDALPALYFACSTEDSVDGRLFIFGLRSGRAGVSKVVLSGSPEAELPWAGQAIGRYAASTWTNTVGLVDESPLDLRMRAQAGRFLVGGLVKRYAGKTLTCQGKRLPAVQWNEISTLDIFFPRKSRRPPVGSTLGWSILIPAHWKSEVRALLKEYGLTQDSIYPPITEVRRLADRAVRLDP